MCEDGMSLTDERIKALADIATILMAEDKFKLLNANISILEELQSAERYSEEYNSTKDLNYKNMAIDELKHATFLIKHEKIKGNDVEMAEKEYLRIKSKLELM